MFYYCHNLLNNSELPKNFLTSIQSGFNAALATLFKYKFKNYSLTDLIWIWKSITELHSHTMGIVLTIIAYSMHMQ